MIKDRFIQKITSQKTRALLLQMLNMPDSATVLTSQTGKIHFYNETFSALIRTKLSLESVPPSIMDLIPEDLKEQRENLKAFF